MNQNCTHIENIPLFKNRHVLPRTVTFQTKTDIYFHYPYLACRVSRYDRYKRRSTDAIALPYSLLKWRRSILYTANGSSYANACATIHWAESVKFLLRTHATKTSIGYAIDSSSKFARKKTRVKYHSPPVLTTRHVSREMFTKNMRRSRPTPRAYYHTCLQ